MSLRRTVAQRVRSSRSISPTKGPKVASGLGNFCLCVFALLDGLLEQPSSLAEPRSVGFISRGGVIEEVEQI
jgi:hypothetical protein